MSYFDELITTEKISNEKFAGICRKDLTELLYSDEKISVNNNAATTFPEALQQAVAKRNNKIRILQQYVASFINEKCRDTMSEKYKKCLQVSNNIINSPVSVAFVGKTNSGKSTLLSSQLMSSKEKIILPCLEKHCTTRLTVFVYSPTKAFKERDIYEQEVCVTEQPLRFATMGSLDQKLNRKRERDGNCLNKDAMPSTIAELGLPNELLKAGVQLMDFPSLNENNMLGNFVFESVKLLKPTIVCYVYDYNCGFNLTDAEAIINLQYSLAKDEEGKMTQFMVVVNKVDMAMDDDTDDDNFDSKLNAPLSIDVAENDDDNFDSKLNALLGIAEKELMQNCEATQLKLRNKSLNFKVENLLPIVPISAFELVISEPNATKKNYLKKFKDFQNQLLQKISTQPMNYLRVIERALESKSEQHYGFINYMWLVIQSLKLEQSLKTILNDETSLEKHPCIQFNRWYKVYIVTVDDATYHITKIANNPFGAFNFEDKKAGDIITQYKTALNPIDFRAYLSEDDSSVFLILKCFQMKRVMDSLTELSADDLLIIMKEVVAMNSVLKLTAKHFRPDNIYFDCSDKSHCFISHTVPIDLPLNLKNRLMTDAYHFINDKDCGFSNLSGCSLDNDDTKTIADLLKKLADIRFDHPNLVMHQTVLEIDENLFAEFMYSFGWFVWILVEGTAEKEFERGGDYAPEAWLEMIPSDRMKEFPDYLSEVMKLCWSVTRKDIEGNNDKWFQVCQLFGDEDLMFNAVHYNKPERIQRCVDEGADVNNFLNSTKYTPLSMSAHNGYLECVEKLLALNADPNKPGRPGETPLILATSNGHAHVVKELLKHGADPNIGMSEVGMITALHVAVHYKHYECLRELLEHGYKETDDSVVGTVQKTRNINQKKSNGSTPLLDAALTGTAATVKMLLEHGADPEIADDFGVSPLYAAAVSGSQECIQWIYLHYWKNIKKEIETVKNEAKTHTNSTDLKKELLKRHGATYGCPSLIEYRHLFESACQGNTIIHLELLLKKSYLNFQNNNGLTAVMEACRKGHTQCLLNLLTLGADLDIQVANNGPTALHFSVANGNTDCLELLLLMGASVDLEAHGLQAIHVASQTGQLECFKILMKYQADINVKNTKQLTPLMLATAYERVDLIRWMLQNNADANLSDRDGNLPIHVAAELGLMSVLEVFIQDSNVNINAQNKFGFTPLHFAQSNDNTECEKLLLDNKAEVHLLPNHVFQESTIKTDLKDMKDLDSCNFICPMLRNITKWGRQDDLSITLNKYPKKRLPQMILLPDTDIYNLH